MKRWGVALLLVALTAGAVGCAETETKTVTETVRGAQKQPAEEVDAASSEGATTDEPTATTIPDGIWAKGEYKPGRYRAPGGEFCSWEKRQKLGGEAEGEGFNDSYGYGETNILLEIDSPYFKTQECGVWQKVR